MSNQTATIDQPVARKFRLCDWERNGYNDSDFYGMYYDEADGQLHTIEIGTTRFACQSYGFGPEYLMPTPEIVEKARVILADRIFAALRHAEDRNVLEPEPKAIYKGAQIKLSKDHEFMLSIKEERACFKCEGSGSFTGRIGKVIGQCFACKGTGKLNCKTGKKVKDAVTGKAVRQLIKAGTEFTALCEPEFFGTIYRNGYNTINRHNTTVKVSVEIDGGKRETVRLPMAKVRLAKEPASDPTLRQRAEQLSYHYNFGAIGGCTAWMSSNWAAEAGKKAPSILIEDSPCAYNPTLA